MNSGRAQSELFEPAAPDLPEGMRYEAEFLTPAEEESLVAVAQSLPLAEMNYKGYTARRRVASYGGSYDFDANRLREAQALPPSLEPLRDKVAAWAGVAPEAFTQALVAEYRPRTPLGWHRDVPDFEDVVGVSLLGEATMRLRPYPPRDPKKGAVLKLLLEPRSIYLLRGAARWGWQHSVAATTALRYSITFRTARRR
ncbi:MAG TPA: alpha-ketoglutarate-dependent dioxygenase AlkB [Ramlibacter sp.]